MIIWLASYPRSGNTLCWSLLKRMYGAQLYDSYLLPDSPASLNNPGAQLPGSPITEHTLQSLAASDQYYFLKTHEMPLEDYPALYVVRDGRDALVSYTHFALDHQGVSKVIKRLRYGRKLQNLIQSDFFGGWSGNVEAWANRSTPTAIMKFEDLVKDAPGTLRKALRQLDYLQPEADNPDLPDFDTLHQANPQIFRKGQVGSWREDMPDKLHKLFWERHGEAMDLMGYTWN